MSIENKILEYSLPILSSGAEKEYLETVKVLSEMIIDPEENKEFFGAPTKYLKSKGLLTVSELELPTGDKVSLFDDDEIAKTLREFRKRFQAGEGIGLPTAIIYKEDVLIERRYAIYKDYKFQAVSDFKFTSEQLKKLDINPLMSPLSREKIRNFVESQENKAID